MTRIVIEGAQNREGLIAALAVVLEVMNHDGAFEHEEQRFLPEAPREDRSAGPDPPNGPLPLIPCPSRGTHTRLTDCWMCWSDVMRGAALEPEVLNLAAWHSGRS